MLDLHRHLVHVVGRGLLIRDLLVVGTCHLRNFGPLTLERFGCKLAALRYAPSLETKEKSAVYLYFWRQPNNIEQKKEKP